MDSGPQYCIYKLVILLSNIVFIIGWFYYLIKFKAFEMNAKRLTHQLLFWAAITIPVIFFFTFGLIAWLGYHVQLDGEGFSTFIEISKLPIALLSLSIPFSIIVNNIHRTIQTEAQIVEAQKKNMLDRFYAHRKNTIETFQNLPFEHLEVMGQEITLAIKNSYKEYMEYFPDASINNDIFEPNVQKLESVASWLNSIFDHIENYKNPSPEETLEMLKGLGVQIYGIHHTLGLKSLNINSYNKFSITTDTGMFFSIETIFRTEDEIKRAIYAYFNAYSSIYHSLGKSINLEVGSKIEKLLQYSISEKCYFDELNKMQPIVVKGRASGLVEYGEIKSSNHHKFLRL